MKEGFALEIYEQMLAGEFLQRSGIDVALFEFSGPDHVEWLHGQLTADVMSLETGEFAGYCMCVPKGQMVACGRIYRFQDRILLTCASDSAPAVQKRFEDGVVMEEVDMTWHRGLNVIREWGSGLQSAVEADFSLPDELGVLHFNNEAKGTSPEEAAAAAAIQMEMGVPRWGQDITPTILPPEMGPAFEAAHVSYNKGCYTGQEVLMRLHSRGHTNRQWVVLQSESDLEAKLPVLASGEVKGSVTSSVWHPKLGWLAGAFLRHEALSSDSLVGGARVRLFRS